MFAEIDTIAELIGSTASDADSPRGHYSAVRTSGRCITTPSRFPTAPATTRGAISDAGSLILGSVALIGSALGDCSWSSSAYAGAITASA